MQQLQLARPTRHSTGSGPARTHRLDYARLVPSPSAPGRCRPSALSSHGAASCAARVGEFGRGAQPLIPRDADFRRQFPSPSIRATHSGSMFFVTFFFPLFFPLLPTDHQLMIRFSSNTACRSASQATRSADGVGDSASSACRGVPGAVAAGPAAGSLIAADANPCSTGAAGVCTLDTLGCRGGPPSAGTSPPASSVAGPRVRWDRRPTSLSRGCGALATLAPPARRPGVCFRVIPRCRSPLDAVGSR